MYACTHTHTHKRTHVYVRTHTRRHAHTHTYVRTYVGVRTHAGTHFIHNSHWLISGKEGCLHIRMLILSLPCKRRVSLIHCCQSQRITLPSSVVVKTTGHRNCSSGAVHAKLWRHLRRISLAINTIAFSTWRNKYLPCTIHIPTTDYGKLVVWGRENACCMVGELHAMGYGKFMVYSRGNSWAGAQKAHVVWQGSSWSWKGKRHCLGLEIAGSGKEKLII